MPRMPKNPDDVRYNEQPFRVESLKEFADMANRLGQRAAEGHPLPDETALLNIADNWPTFEPRQLKRLLAQLSMRSTPKCYSKIKEIVAELEDEDLRSFAHIAMNVGQIKLESDLLGEPMMMMVASPLGGVGRRLRAYFAVISDEKLDEPRFRLVRAAYEDACRELDGVLESAEWTPDFILLGVLLSFDVALNDLIERGLEECPFLEAEFLATNVMKPTGEQILDWKQGRKRRRN